MEARELRIGNYVYKIVEFDYPDHNWEVTDIKLEDFYNASRGGNEDQFFKDYCKPIPLTEEWLSKLEFERDQEGAFVLDKYLIDGDNDSGYGMFKILNTNKLIYDCLVSNLNYVHQLQNIYFALTGEELTIKKDLFINESGEIDKEVFDNL